MGRAGEEEVEKVEEVVEMMVGTAAREEEDTHKKRRGRCGISLARGGCELPAPGAGARACVTPQTRSLTALTSSMRPAGRCSSRSFAQL